MEIVNASLLLLKILSDYTFSQFKSNVTIKRKRGV